MSRIRFLCDEDVDVDLISALQLREPALEFQRVGQPPAPLKRTSDLELLRYAEAEKLLLITADKRTMPGHLAQHYAAGRHTWGVLILRLGFPWPRYIDNLLLVWHATEAEEWQDRVDYLPW
jgi:hypothetical protein